MTTHTQSSILTFYQSHKPDFSWQDIADILNTNKGTAWEIAHGKRTPTQDQELRWMFWLTFGPSADYRTIPAIPCPTCGQLHQVNDCHGQDGEPVIVPAGARIVQSKTTQPRRHRVRLDITGLPLNAQEAREILLWWLEPYRRDWPDWVQRQRPETEQDAGR